MFVLIVMYDYSDAVDTLPAFLERFLTSVNPSDEGAVLSSLSERGTKFSRNLG